MPIWYQPHPFVQVSLFVVAITSALSPFLPYLAVALLIAVVVAKRLQAPKQKGQAGEAWVRFFAYWGLPARTYKRLHNLTLRVEDGTTQIDHVFLSRYGLFVVETKHMKGRIVGGEREPRWLQTVGRHSYSFQNPLRQNYRHLKALEYCLGIDMAHLHSVVVFTGPARLKRPMHPQVVRGWGLARHIRRYDEPVFSQAQVAAFTRALKQQRLPPGEATDRAHVEGLRRRHGRRNPGKRRGLMLTSLLGMAVAGGIAYADRPLPLITQAIKALQPIGRDVNSAAATLLASAQGTLKRGTPVHVQPNPNAPVHVPGPEQSLRACIKPDNLVDDDVRHCMNGTRMRDW